VLSAGLAYLFLSREAGHRQPPEAMAQQLGETLETARLSWPILRITPIFGWILAKRARPLVPAFDWAMIRSWNKNMINFSKPPAWKSERTSYL